jgi:zinc and cadmium transporter
MDSKFAMIMAAVVLDGIAGLSGGILPVAFVHRHFSTLLAFAAGTLVGAAFLDLLPDALATATPPQEIMLAALAGFVAFYLVESFLGSHATGQSGHKHSTIGPMILVGDALHNATDGVAIAAAFLADVKTGVATTLAVIVHELPQEIGDYSILVTHGYSRRKALLSLVAVQFAAVIGALGALWASTLTAQATPLLMAVSAGGFLYIAAADLLPELQRNHEGAGAVGKSASFAAGIGIIAVLEPLMH